MSLAPVVRAVDAALEATVVLSFSRIGHVVRSRLGRWAPVEQLDGAGRTIVVTGANSGLGYATAHSLLATGARVRLLVRDEERGEDAAAQLRREIGQQADVGVDLLDLADLASVRRVAKGLREREGRIDAVVHNAGAMFPERDVTIDGLERTYQLHVVGPHLLTTMLLPALIDAAPARVVTVTSGGMYTEKLDAGRVDSPGRYRPSVAYARAKRAQVALTGRWQRQAGHRGVDFHVAHPGWALTPGLESSLPGFRRITGPVLRDATEGADTIAWLVLSDEVGAGGQLWHDRRPRSPHKVPWTQADAGETERMWDRVCTDAGVDRDP